MIRARAIDARQGDRSKATLRILFSSMGLMGIAGIDDWSPAPPVRWASA
jgi:hypothetical protein